MPRITVTCNEEAHEALRLLAYEQRTTVTEIIRRAINAYVSNKKGQDA